MRHVTRPLALMLAGSLASTGCATAHLSGEYSPGPKGSNISNDVTSKTEKQNLAEGSDWVLFWGLVEAASTDLGAEARGKLRPDEQIRDAEVRNHLSLPGALLWIITAGLVSHHDLVLSGSVESLKPIEKPVEKTTTQREIVPAAAPVVVVTGERAGLPESELYREATIDRTIDEVAANFNDSARSAGLIPLSQIRWEGLTGARRTELKGEIPENRLEAVESSKINSFIVTTDHMVNDVKKEPQCGAFVPSIVCYEKGGKTHVFYFKPTGKLRDMDASGRVGEGKMMNRASYDEHMTGAREYERCCEQLIKNLEGRSESGTRG